ncbi:MAG: hypothetical protein K6F97_11585 [Lachnospiraceae bacterium]|jgi:hypothetical protein|nr:hypothetical protein [Lachnospiraceae bacterium]
MVTLTPTRLRTRKTPSGLYTIEVELWSIMANSVDNLKKFSADFQNLNLFEIDPPDLIEGDVTFARSTSNEYAWYEGLFNTFISMPTNGFIFNADEHLRQSNVMRVDRNGSSMTNIGRADKIIDGFYGFVEGFWIDYKQAHPEALKNVKVTVAQNPGAEYKVVDGRVCVKYDSLF